MLISFAKIASCSISYTATVTRVIKKMALCIPFLHQLLQSAPFAFEDFII